MRLSLKIKRPSGSLNPIASKVPLDNMATIFSRTRVRRKCSCCSCMRRAWLSATDSATKQ